MAKAKKEKVETVETLVGDMEVLSSESVVPEPVIEPLPITSVTPEPKEVEVEIPTDLIKSIGEIPTSPITFTDNSQVELSMEQKIENYLEGKEGFVKANDFLKSLFGVPKFNEPAQWMQQGSSKLLKMVLDGMVSKNDLVVKDNLHRILGQSYYPDTTTGKQQHRSLSDVDIFIKK